MKEPKLVIKDLTMMFDGQCILDKLNFEVLDGEFLSILGPSGCGKTTLLRILTGLLSPTEGTIVKDGKDITGSKPDARGMGIVFQNYALFENMTVLENIEYALKIRKENKTASKKKELRETVLTMIDRMGLSEYKKKKPVLLSGGQQQRVAIARTLVMKPDIILFDEPMSALDIATRLTLREEIKRIQTDFKTTMIYITHDQEEAFAMSDRVMVMQKANIAQIGTPTEIVKNPENDYVKSFVIDNLRIKTDSLMRFMEDMR